MASTINAITTGTGGIQTTADATGNISLQSNGSNVLNTTASGVSIPGTLGVTGAMTASGGLAVTGTLTVNGSSPGRSGATTTDLTSGSPTLTLTSSSNQLQYVTANAAGCSVVMPDATTLTAGHDYFTIFNAGSYPIAIKDNGGTIREYISPSTTLTASIKSIATSNGVWQFGNPPTLNATPSWIPMTTVSGYVYVYVIPVTSTQAVVVYNDTATQMTIKCRLLTFNASTKVITYGSEITIATVGTNTWAEYSSAASDGVDRGFISWCTRSSGSSGTTGHYYVGFAIVSGTLYISTVQTGLTRTSAYFTMLDYGNCYLGANNAFISFAGSYLANSAGTATTLALDIRMFTVTVAGTTVTVTNSASNTTISNTGSTSVGGNLPPYVARTSLTTFVYDIFNGTSVYQSGGYINCNTSANTFSTGARTSQTTQMVNVTIPQVSRSGWFPFVVNSAGTRVMSAGYFTTVSNVGSATVTTAVSSDITIKPFTATQYNTALSSYGAYAFPYDYYSNGYFSYLDYGSGFSVSSSEYIVIVGSTYWSLDPSSSTFNVNTGTVNFTTNPIVAGSYVIPTLLSATNLFVGSATVAYASSLNQYDILTLASPFKN
jgi:hypothetical protein